MPSLASGIADQGQRGFPETDARMSQMSCDLLRVEAVQAVEECNVPVKQHSLFTTDSNFEAGGVVYRFFQFLLTGRC